MSLEMIEQSEEPVFGFRCSHENCQESFNRIVDLHNHLFYVHNKVKQECPVCQQQFPTAKLLRLHEKTHGEYACPICDQRFNEKAYLKLHLRNHDVEREIFECPFCEKTFKHKGNLQVHIKSIHEKKKFRCMLCDRELSTKQKLDQHMDKKHQALDEELEIDLKELERFEKEWADRQDEDRPESPTTKKIKLEPDLIKRDVENFDLTDSNLELLYTD